jgi:hypothetical protein
MLKLAVVTPYWQESPETLARCLATVRQQTLAASHYLVADGHPQSLPESTSLVHIVLPENIGNSGATPRGIGAQLAFNDGYDVVAFIDADNWLEPDHLEKAVTLLEREHLDVVFARRNIVFPDGEKLTVEDPQDADHVDTNCYVISKRAAFLAMVWGMWPRAFGAGEDRLMYLVAQYYGLRTAWLDARTVWYETNWRIHYQLAGKKPVRPMRKPTRSASTHFDRESFFRNTGIMMPIQPSPQATPIIDRPQSEWRIAVVTAYQGEGEMALRRCLDSVAGQTCAVVRHYVVSDSGNTCPVVAEHAGVMHLRLPGCRDDHGNTARGLGAAIAFQRGYDAVMFLDAAGWLEPNHLQTVLRALAQRPASVALSAPNALAGDKPDTGKNRAEKYITCGMLVLRREAYLGSMWAQLPVMPSARQQASLYASLAVARGVEVLSVRAETAHPDMRMKPSKDKPASRPSLSKSTLIEKMGLRLIDKAANHDGAKVSA